MDVAETTLADDNMYIPLHLSPIFHSKAANCCDKSSTCSTWFIDCIQNYKINWWNHKCSL